MRVLFRFVIAMLRLRAAGPPMVAERVESAQIAVRLSHR